ncbi:Type I restriction-modification system, specificity subunit S [Nitrospira tepida]|uniref:Type I restriction-modification system, specificity subunit S n=2 Tax=Nitrospira tepida TaxID=2973512 RepID=A0AA86TA94_9BACT|nr:Type I restriction-modification system, specificity subunit S [Nitrospira tepida]
MSEGWRETPLSELASITMGQSPQSSCINTGERGLPFLQGCAEFGKRVPAAKLHCSPPLRVAKSGSVLMSVRAPVGTTNFADMDYCIGRGLGAVSAKQDVADNIFLLHAIEQNVGFLHRRSQGSTFLAIGSKDLSALPVPSLALGMQRRIAEILSTVDEAIEQTEALIAKYQQIKAGLMHDLFTRGVTPDGRLRHTRVEAPHLYKESPLGWIPKEWEVVRLDMVSEVDRGKFTVRPRNDPRFYGGQYPFIQTGDVAFAGGRTLKSYAQSLNELGLSVSKLFPPGTIMVTIAANIADTCILGMPMCAPDSLVGVQPKTREDARFIELSIRRRKSWLESRAPQTAQRNINLEDLRPLIIPWPKGWERSRISEIYETQDSAIRACEEQLAKLQKEKQGLMHDLLSGRVRVDG